MLIGLARPCWMLGIESKPASLVSSVRFARFCVHFAHTKCHVGQRANKKINLLPCFRKSQKRGKGSHDSSYFFFLLYPRGDGLIPLQIMNVDVNDEYRVTFCRCTNNISVE